MGWVLAFLKGGDDNDSVYGGCTARGGREGREGEFRIDKASAAVGGTCGCGEEIRSEGRIDYGSVQVSSTWATWSDYV